MSQYNEATFETQFMKKLSNTEAEKISVFFFKKACIPNTFWSGNS